MQLYNFGIDKSILFLYGIEECYPLGKDNAFRIHQGPLQIIYYKLIFFHQ